MFLDLFYYFSASSSAPVSVYQCIMGGEEIVTVAIRGKAA